MEQHNNIKNKYRHFVCELYKYYYILLRHNRLSIFAINKYRLVISNWFGELVNHTIDTDTMRKQLPDVESAFNYFTKAAKDFEKIT